MNFSMFQRTSRQYIFLLAFAFQIGAFFLMTYDPTPQGFGWTSLKLAPMLLIIGLLLPAIAFSRKLTLSNLKSTLVKDLIKAAGFIAAFIIPLIVYAMTLEPTASLWDCSETIATAYKLQVPHTPGIPLTLLIAKLFSLLSFGDVSKVGWYINFMSAFFSALAVGFCYLITWYFGSQFIRNRWVLFIGSVAGSLCLAFSDSFWFSAVEAETYGPSIFFMVFLIWLTIKGNEKEVNDRKARIYQLAYLTGLSYCIHPMCILILPVCVLIWRNKEQKSSWKQMLISVMIGVLFILFISKVIAVDLFEWVFKLDLFLVNKWNLPFYSGVLLLMLLMSGGLMIVWKKYEKARMMIVCLLMLLLGFSPYLMLFIRSSKLPPINEFVPNNLAKIKPYMNRESYPSRPLLYGPYFDAKIASTSPKATAYVVKDGGYRPVGEVPEYHYEKDRMTILPRIYSNEAAHIAIYREWTGLKEGEKPRFSHNLAFMLKYQLGHMFGRYFMWNFSGRASDIQHAGWLAPWEGSAKGGFSKATNQHFMLPLVIGIFGLFIQFKRDRNNFVSNLLFFLITGLLLAVYLNATPNEPRERDYIYVGSYTAFSIWIGLGIMAISKALHEKSRLYVSPVIAASLVGWMLIQNWDDHDRSNRWFHMANAKALLDSCEKNAILFTGGDNDTFPLWYLQEVEGFRTDVRVKVMSYFNADWYINQLSRPYYDSPAMELSLKKSRNEYGPYNPIYVFEKTESPILWDRYMVAINNENRSLILENGGSEFYMLPSRKISLPVGDELLNIHVNGSYLPKSELAILDIIESNDLSRPVYFNFTALSGLNINLRPYLHQEGLVYRLRKDRSADGDIQMDNDKMYENLVVKADYSNLKETDVYFNHEDYNSRMILPIKFAFNSLIDSHIRKGELKKAEELTHFVLDHLYLDHLEASYGDLVLANFMRYLDMEEQATILEDNVFEYFHDKLMTQLKQNENFSRNDVLVLQEAARVTKNENHLERLKDLLTGLGVT